MKPDSSINYTIDIVKASEYTQAVGFYEHLDFKVMSRSELDSLASLLLPGTCNWTTKFMSWSNGASAP